MPFSLFLHSEHLELPLIIQLAHFLQKICWHDTQTAYFRFSLQCLQIYCGLYFYRSFIQSGSSLRSGLAMRFHRSLSAFSQSLSSSQPVLQLLRSCRQMQLFPNTQYPESCQSLHKLGSQSILIVFLAPPLLLALVGPCFHLQCSIGFQSSAQLNLQFAYAFAPRYILVLNFPSFICFVIYTFYRYFFLAYYVSWSMASYPTNICYYCFYPPLLYAKDQKCLCTSASVQVFRLAVDPPIKFDTSSFYNFTFFFGLPIYSSPSFFIQSKSMPLFLTFLFLNILPNYYNKCYYKSFIVIEILWMIQSNQNTGLIAKQQQKQRQQESRFQRQQNKLRNLALKLLFGHIDKNIDNLDQSLETILKMMKEQIEGDQIVLNKWEQYNQIKMELQIFVYQLKDISGVWINLLKRSRIEAEGNKYTLNTSITITEVYEQLIERVNENIQIKISEKMKQKKLLNPSEQKEETQFDFQKDYLDQTGLQLMAMLLNYIAKQIVLCFEIGKAHIIKQTQQIQQLIKKSQIMNSYVLFGLLKQMSRQTFNSVKINFQNTFVGISHQISNQFSRFVQVNYEVMHLHYRQSKEGTIFRKQQRKQILQKQAYKIIQILCKEKIGGAKKSEKQQSKQNGKQKLTAEQKQIADQIVQKTVEESKQIANKDSKAKKSKWKIVDLKDSVQKVCQMFKNNIKQQITADTGQAVQSDLMNTVPASANLGGSLGKCLVDIDQYKSVNQFFVDLSKNAMIGGSIAVMLDQVPILNYFIIAGGLSYTVYRSYKDQISSSMKKMKEVSQASVLAVGAVGSTVTGMILGQVLIPVPFLGAFIGGVVGGFIGEKGSRQINSILNNQSFMRLIKYLHRTAIQNKKWEYSDELLQKLGISKKYFEGNFSVFSQKHAWITAICFCVVAYYQARRHIEHTQQKLKEKQENSSKKSDLNSKQNAKINHKLSLQSRIELKDFFQNQFDLVGTIDYLTINEIYLVKELPRLQVSVRHWIK